MSARKSVKKFGTKVDVAIAIVFDRAGERVLICQRRHDTVLPNYWEFPGGKVNDGETLAACAVREVREELGIEVETVKELTRIEHDYPHAFVRLHPFVCRHVAGDVALLCVADARWVAPAEVKAYTFPAANGALVERVARGWLALVGG